jgi:hypothetical protein
MIPNPTPVTATFNGMWISNARIIMPAGRIDARVQAYDPTTKHLLATGSKDVRGKALTPELVASITAHLKRIAVRNSDIRVIHVGASDPTKPVNVTVMFSEGRPYSIRDAFALAATDEDFAEVFTAAMNFIAA